MRGNETAVRLLIGRSDTDINCKDMDGRTLISWAAQKGHEAAVQLLIVLSIKLLVLGIKLSRRWSSPKLLLARGRCHITVIFALTN